MKWATKMTDVINESCPALEINFLSGLIYFFNIPTGYNYRVVKGVKLLTIDNENGFQAFPTENIAFVRVVKD